MTLWRISEHASLDGGGGLRWSARWHAAGRRIVYCALNPATALLEVLVHAEIRIENVPVNLRYFEIEAPDGLDVEDVDANSLAASWRTDPLHTRRIGDQWLQSARTALFRVPSAIVPATRNVLINPLHPESGRIRIVREHRQEIDPRLLKAQ